MAEAGSNMNAILFVVALLQWIHVNSTRTFTHWLMGMTSRKQFLQFVLLDSGGVDPGWVIHILSTIELMYGLY